MVVAGVGVDHDELVNTVKKWVFNESSLKKLEFVSLFLGSFVCFRYFVDEDPVWEEHPELIKTEKHFLPDDSVAQYTGGIVQVCTIRPALNSVWTVESNIWLRLILNWIILKHVVFTKND